jgi:hypothetical protein
MLIGGERSFVWGVFWIGGCLMPYALFDGDERVSEAMPTELDVWKRALEAGLISDLPVADEDGGQLLPPGFHVKQVDEAFDARARKLPREIT